VGSYLIHRLVILALAAGIVVVAAAPARADVEIVVSAGEVAVLTSDDDLVYIDLDPDDDDDSSGSEDSGAGDPGDAGGGSGGAGAGSAPPPSQPVPPAAAPAPPAAEPRRPAPIAARHLVRPDRMRPVLGRVVGRLRPTLRWRHRGRGVRIYNVQVFLRGEKVLSAFPASRYYRVPAGHLLPGRRYVWRVWPYTTRSGYPARPLGVSWFATPGRPPLDR